MLKALTWVPNQQYRQLPLKSHFLPQNPVKNKDGFLQGSSE
jgi:hypothetical protein